VGPKRGLFTIRKISHVKVVALP